MTEVQTITKQLATYEAKVNATEYERRRALEEIDHCRKERARLEVLRELGEVEQAEIDALDERVREAVRVRDEATTQLELSNRAKSELEGRIEKAKEGERREAKHQALLDYRSTAKELLELLGPVAERYEALGVLYRQVGDQRLEGAGRSGLVGTKGWSECLQSDLQKIDARLSEGRA